MAFYSKQNTDCECDDYITIVTITFSSPLFSVFRFLKLEKFDKGSALDGKLLTMTCSAKGSEYISFEWSKNGAIIDVSKTHRNMWIVRIPNGANKLDNTYNSVLNIEKVHKLDAGKFSLL